MKTTRLSIAVLFLTSSAAVFYGQEVNDTIKKESKIEGVVIQGNSNRKTETAILMEQKKAIVQKQSIGAEEISRKGISNLEQGLTKITGINTVESRGLFVRGLEERYNSLLVNGLATPSNNPFQKIIELKQFPTDIVGKFDVYKTYNANLFGDFAGATFDVETLVPETEFTKLEFSVGFNSLSTFRDDFKISPSANSMDGYIGLNSRDRQLPDEIRDFRPSAVTIPNTSFKDSWNVDNIKSFPNTGIGFTTSQKFGNSRNVGMLFSLNQSTEYEFREGNDNTFDTNGDFKNKLYKTEYNYNVQSSALLGLSYKIANTKINLVSTFLQNSNNIIQDYDGYRDNKSEDIMFFRTNQQDISRLTDIQLLASQKIGERHNFKLGGSWVNNWYEQPDRKTFYGVRTGDNQLLMSYGGNNMIRQYLDLSGTDYFSGLAEYQLSLGEKNDQNTYPITFTLGYNGFADKRTMSYRFIFSKASSSAGQVIDIDSPDQSFNSAIQNGLFKYEESNQPNFKNFMYQYVNAGYGSINYKPNPTWDILAGARAEKDMSIIRWKAISDDVNGGFRNIVKNRTYILPSLSVKKAINTKSNIRFSASKTITRPILIEILPIEYINPDNNNIAGNYDRPNATFGENFRGLDNSQNYNVDLKYEIFPKNNELLAINVFGKKIDRAIERSYIPSSNSNGTLITFFNAKTATLLGAELETLINLNRFSENLSRWSIGMNATFIYSDVKRSQAQEDETNINSKRTLQGAAPWMVNADLKYDFKNSNNLKRTMSLVYNVTGKKIYGVGFGSLDNVYELPFNQLDFILQGEITKKVEVKLGIYNILDQTYKLELGDESTVKILSDDLRMEDYKKGISFNMSVGYKF
ncbi:MAG: TonB-dependent receptor [Kaistella sp.]|nr:TonB-dependent receptor [Kaistella sp.]